MASKSDPQNQLDRIRKLEQQVADFERLHEVLETISSASRVDDTLDRIVEATLELCNADQASIFLLGPQSSQAATTLIRKGSSGEEKLDHYLNNLLSGWIY